MKRSKRGKNPEKLKQKNLGLIKRKNIEKTLMVVKTNIAKEPNDGSILERTQIEDITEIADNVKGTTIESIENIPQEFGNFVSSIGNEDNTDRKNRNIVPVNNVNKKKIASNQNDKTVFVGNIPSNTKINQLKKLFLKCTILSCRFRLANGKPILKHKMRKEADSITAWLVFEQIKDVEFAIKLNGCEFKGRHIRVTKSEEKTSNDHNDKCTIFVGNLKYSANDEKLYSIFSTCGEIEFVRTIQNAKGCSGVAYVCFKKPDSVGLALELNKTFLDDRPINVEKYSKNKSGASKKRKPEKEISGVQRRIMSKLMKVKNISEKLPSNNFYNKCAENKKCDSNLKLRSQSKSVNGKKKSEFKGIKVDSKKKIKKMNTKNSLHWHALAKKIAPKE